MDIPTIRGHLKASSQDNIHRLSVSSLGLNDTTEKLEEGIEQFLIDLGLDPRTNKEIQETPKRFARALQEMTMGYSITLQGNNIDPLNANFCALYLRDCIYRCF